VNPVTIFDNSATLYISKVFIFVWIENFNFEKELYNGKE
jgi:hypothetical protein